MKFQAVLAKTVSNADKFQIVLETASNDPYLRGELSIKAGRCMEVVIQDLQQELFEETPKLGDLEEQQELPLVQDCENCGGASDGSDECEMPEDGVCPLWTAKVQVETPDESAGEGDMTEDEPDPTAVA